MNKVRAIFFYLFLLAFCLAITTTAVGYDFDLWARLIAGMSVVQTGVVLKQDFLSYTPTHTWYDHEWGSGVVFYLTQHHLGPAGLLVLQGVLLFLIFFIVSRVIALRGVKSTTPYNILFYLVSFASVSRVLNMPVRCQMFSFVFFALFILILELVRSGKQKLIWILPVLMIVWNNLHGGCAAGIGLLGLYAAGEFLNRKGFKHYVFAFLACLLVLPINPWGISYIPFLFSALIMKRPDVMEWWGLFSKFYLHKYILLKTLMAIFGLSLLPKLNNFSLKTIDYTKVMVVSATLYMSVMHVKLVPLFVIAAMCFMYDDFYEFFNWLINGIFRGIFRGIFDKTEVFKNVVIYTIIGLFAFFSLPEKFNEPLLGWKQYPLREIQFIKQNNIKGKLLINFGLGSYAAYKLYPNNLIFMDGRYEEVYYNGMVPLLKKFYLVNNMNKGGWDEVLKKFPPDVMVIENYYPVYKVLKRDKRWTCLFEGDLFGVFVPRWKEKSSYDVPTNDIKYYKNTLFDTRIKFVLKSKL